MSLFLCVRVMVIVTTIVLQRGVLIFFLEETTSTTTCYLPLSLVQVTNNDLLENYTSRLKIVHTHLSLIPLHLTIIPVMDYPTLMLLRVSMVRIVLCWKLIWQAFEKALTIIGVLNKISDVNNRGRYQIYCQHISSNLNYHTY